MLMRTRLKKTSFYKTFLASRNFKVLTLGDKALLPTRHVRSPHLKIPWLLKEYKNNQSDKKSEIGASFATKVRAHG